LQAHDAIGLRPAPVVAHRHAKDAAERAPDLEAEIARLEVAFLQVLEGALGIELRMARQMDLAVFPDDLGGFVGEDAGVEMMPVRRQFGISEAHRHLVPRGALEQRLRCRVRHLPLEPGIDLGLIQHVPARKECGEGQFRIDDQIGALGFGLIHQRDHALDDGFAAVGFLNRTHLGGGNIDDAHDWFPKDTMRREAFLRTSESIRARRLQPLNAAWASGRSQILPIAAVPADMIAASSP
jgi:hypothetical protein